MDDALVFSSNQKIKIYCSYVQIVPSEFSKSGQPQTYLTALTHNKYYPQKQKQLQRGKMGCNFIFSYNLQKQISIKMIRKYETHMHGFCKMLNISNRYLLGINQDEKSIQGFNIVNGNKQLKYKLDDEQICESVTCMQAGHQLKDEQTQKTTMNIYLAQEGCKIHKLQLSLCGQSEQDQILETKQSIQIQNKQQIKIITSMLLADDKLYCLIRKSQSLYILQAEPTLKMLHSINFKLSMPKNLSNLNKTIEGLSLFLTDHNKVLRIKLGKESQKIAAIAQLHQSKSIEYLSCTESGICGCSQEKQYFYIQS